MNLQEWLSRVGRDLRQAENSSDSALVDSLLLPHIREGLQHLQDAGAVDDSVVEDFFNYLGRMNEDYGFGFRLFPFLSKILRDLAVHKSDNQELLRTAMEVDRVEAVAG